MKFIDEKFKESSPQKTVEKIRSLLNGIGIEVEELWNDSGIDNCWSLNLCAKGGFPSANGKGVSKEFARASAYGEFIERLQSSLFFYKYQSLECNEEINMQTYAPDSKYLTVEELQENADWMDCIIDAYGGNLSRKALGEQCAMYAHTDNGQILCLPFYSLFEDKHVYMPIGFVEHMYSANGCCVGNSKEEALVHAFAEIMERKGSINTIISGKSLPEIKEEVLNKFPTVSNILKQIRKNENIDVKVFDCSIGNGFPVISTRIINKENHSYVVNVAADPVFEIAIQRTLTEIFQGRNIKNFTSGHNGKILSDLTEIRTASNVLNQLESGNGLYTIDYFTEEITCERAATDFEDNSNLSNSELLAKILKLYKDIGKPVYIRNYAFLGFPCYKVIIPGFSESRGLKLNEPLQEYAIGDLVSRVLRNPLKANLSDLNNVLFFRRMIADIVSRCHSFTRLSGIPIKKPYDYILFNATLGYINYKLGNIKDTLKYLNKLSSDTVPAKDYFSCLSQYLHFKSNNIDEEKIVCILNKFHKKDIVKKLLENLKNDTLFDEYLLACDTVNCETCKHREVCNFTAAKKVIASAGKVYSTFVDGQNKENFIFS